MNKNQIVDDWLEKYENPMKEVVMAMRNIILTADDRMEETIKWQAPTFTYKGNLATFFPKAKKHASLMFHTGKTIPGNFSSLEGDASAARTMKVKDMDDLAAKKDELIAIVRIWCEMMDG